MSKKCETCRFFLPVLEGSSFGECWRYPPVPILYTDHDGRQEVRCEVPSVKKAEWEWCGEWAPTDEAQEAARKAEERRRIKAYSDEVAFQRTIAAAIQAAREERDRWWLRDKLQELGAWWTAKKPLAEIPPTPPEQAEEPQKTDLP